MSQPKPPTRKKSSRPAPARRPSSKGALAAIVGADVYRVWIEMLNRLGREGRSHRLFVVVAAMLQHAACQARADQRARRKRGVAIDEDLLDALAEAEPGGAKDLLAAAIIRLFRDAKVPYVRTNRRGDEYSLVEGSIDEYARWFNMPWEE